MQGENDIDKMFVLLLKFIDQSPIQCTIKKNNNCDYSVQEKYGPVGMLHLDAHPDTSETTFGERISNATPFRRAVEEGLLDCKRVVQIGLRGTGNSPFDYEFGRSHVSLSLLSFLRFCFCLQY